MHSRRSVSIIRWFLAGSALAAVVLVYRRWLHVNATTVALTLLLLVLVLAAKWSLRYAVVTAVAATVLYNYFFLPPVGTFTISDPQNWLGLIAFLSTAIIASRLSERARKEAEDARTRQRELEVLFRLSRELLQSENAGSLLSTSPAAVLDVTAARAVMLYLLEGDRLYQAGDTDAEIELPHLRQQALALSEVRQESHRMEVPIRTGVRPKGLLVLRGVPLSVATAQAIGSLISISMERAQALESIARSEAAKESERLRTLMIDSITHELRTPLTSIKGAATALLIGVDRDQEHELLSVIDEECDRLNRLVSEAVEMAQLDAQQVQMHFGPVLVEDLVANARKTCGWIEEKHPLRIDVEPGLVMRADATVFQKVVCNLLENAAKYSPEGSPITITSRASGDMALLSVADRGVGIDTAEQALIFERFYRARSQAESSSGTGMGLAISRAIAEAHGGHIELTSQIGKGSVFTVLIPKWLEAQPSLRNVERLPTA